jgi:protein TonB
MADARSRLLFAIAASGALHLALIYGVTVRPPPAPGSVVVARLGLPGVPPAPTAALARNPLPRPSTQPGGEARLAPIIPDIGSPPPPALPGTAALAAAPPDSSLPSVEMPLLTDPTWYRAPDLDVYPRALGPVAPAYPAQAQREGIGGEVTLVLKVDERGAVQEVAVVQAAPAGYFEAAAMAAFQGARFTPAERDGRSVRSEVVVRVSFDPKQVR